MTESQWVACETLQPMIALLQGRVSDRKNRLFNFACCRRIWQFYPKREIQAAILTGERFADGQANPEELHAALLLIQKERARALGATAQALHAAGFVAAKLNPNWPLQAARETISAVTGQAGDAERAVVQAREERACCALVREVFGYPFRDVALSLSWLSASVTSLAAGIYEERSFEEMPILADALEDAGCADAAILAHCRGAGAHVRGCWVLDLLSDRT